jgi:hypothetical protein
MRFEIAKLTATHPVADFDCGRPALNTFLARHALANQTMGGAQTYVGQVANRRGHHIQAGCGMGLCRAGVVCCH